MLTRSASKKKALSSVQSVAKHEDTSATLVNNVEDTQVIIPSFKIPNGNEIVTSPAVNIGFSFKSPKKEADNNKSNIIFNFGGIVINMPKNDLKKNDESNTKTKINCKCSFSTPKSNGLGKTRSKLSVSDEEGDDDDYRKFSPIGTSSGRKRRSQLQQSRGSICNTEYSTGSSLDSLSLKKRKQDVLSDDETEKYFFFKGVLVNGGYRRDTFAKKPVVRIVPVSEEEIKGCSNLDSSSSSIISEDSTEKQSSRQEALDKQMVRRNKLLEVLKRIDLSVSEQHAKEREMVSQDKNGLDEPVQKECNINKNCKDNVGVRSKQKEFGPGWYTRVFGDFRRKFYGSSETDEGFNNVERDWLAKYINDQDSVQTEIFDNSSEDNQVTHTGEMRAIIEGLMNRIEVPVVDDTMKTPNSEGEGGSSEEQTPSVRHKELTTESKNPEWSEDDSRQEDKKGTEEERPKRKRLFRGRMKNASLGIVIDNTRNKTVIGVGVMQEELQYADRGKLLSIQLECIKQEIVSRGAEIKPSASMEAVKSTRKSKLHEKDVADFDRRPRRSLRFQENTEPQSAAKATDRSRSLKELSESDVTRTPRSTRVQKLRREATESMERKKRKVDDVGDTPKTSKTPKKLAEVESSETDGKEVGLSSSKSRRSSRRRMKEDETGSNEMVEKEPLSTPRKKGSFRKISQIDEEDNEPEVKSSPKSRKSVSPMKQQKEKEEELDEKAMKEVSSPLKKKKEAAEKLRAEEEQLEQAEMRERELVVTSSTKKSKSPVTPRTVEEVSVRVETPIESTPKKKSPKAGKSPVVRQILLEESPTTEAYSPSKQQTAELPEKQGEGESTPEGTEDLAMSSPKRGKSISPKKQQQGQELEEDSGMEMVETASPRQKTNSPQKRQVEEPESTEDSEPEEVTLDATPSPKQLKKISPEKICLQKRAQEDNETEDVEICVVSSPKQLKGKSPKKGGGEHEPEEIDVEMTVLSPKREKSVTPKKQVEQGEVEGSVSEKYMCNVSPHKQKMMNRPTRQQDVELFLTDSSDSEGMEILSSSKMQSSKSPKKALALKESETEITEKVMMSPLKRQASESPKKRVQQEMEENESDGGEMCVTSPTKEETSKSPGNNDLEDRELEGNIWNNMETDVASPRKHKKKKFAPEMNEEDERTEEVASQLLESKRKKKKSKKKNKQNPQEDVEMSIPKLEQDVLASISSQKTSINVTDNNDSQERKKKKKRKRKNKLLKNFLAGEGYIPLDVGGATKFGVVGLDKFKTPTRHPAFDLKTNLLYGSRIKRTPYSQLQAYKMKVESRAMRA